MTIATKNKTEVKTDGLASITKVIASEIIDINTQEYGTHTVANQFPSPFDGLKKGQRRIIWALDQFPDSKVKIAGTSLVSAAMEYHPYGDSSVYQAAVRMSQPFKSAVPLIEIDGDSGTYSGDQAASMRYIEFALPEVTKDLFFKGIDSKSYRMVMNDDLTKLEPAYLIPKLPYALLNANTTVGFGFKSLTVPYAIEDVAKLVMSYSEHVSNRGTIVPWNYKPLVKHFLPHGPITSYIRNPDELISEMGHGNFNTTIITDGTMRIGKDQIEIFTLPLNAEFKLGTKECPLMVQLQKKNSYLEKNIVQLEKLANQKMYGHIRLTIRRGANIFEVANVVKKTIGFTGRITPINNYVIEGAIVNLDPPALLQMWYRQRYNSILAKKKYHQISLTKRLQDVELRLIVCDDTDKVIKIIRQNNEPEGIKLLQEAFDLTLNQAITLMGIPLSTLSNSSKDALKKRQADLEVEQKDLLASYSKVNSEIYDDAEYLSKKYKAEGGTLVPKYLGYVKIGNDGIVQYESEDELVSILSEFERDGVVINQYKKSDKYFNTISLGRAVPYGDLPNCNIPKQIQGMGIHHTSTKRNIKTVCIKNGGISYIDDFVTSTDEEAQLLPVGNKIVTIDKWGKLNHTEVTSFSCKKSVCNGAKSDIIYVYDDTDDERIVLTMNTSCPNQLRLHRVNGKTKKIVTTMAGETKVLGAIKPSEYDDVYITLDQNCLNRTKVSHIKITDLMDLFKKSDYVVVEINHSRSNRRKVKKHKNYPGLITI